MLRDLFDANPPHGGRGRYAPSPTGPLHLGNLRTALVAWLQCRLTGGAFVLRMEDLDHPRTVEGSAEQILDDLRWLGLDWDEGPDVGGPYGPYTQSERDDIYAEALLELAARGLVFRCWCSRKDIAEAASAPHDRSPAYPGTCRALGPDDIVRVQAEKPDRVPAWRFRVGSQVVQIDDEVCGMLSQDLSTEVGDFVLRRADGLFAYQLAVVVDDILMGITDIVRGADLLDSTPRQVALFEAFGFDPPRFWHVPMMHDDRGQRLAKRHESESLDRLRDAGTSAAEVVGRLASTLNLVPEGTVITARELLDHLDLQALRSGLRKH